MAEPPIVTVCISTRHPQDYELTNHADGTRWVIVDGHWQRRYPDQEEGQRDG